MKKRIISMLIAICLTFSILPLTVNAYTQGKDGMGPVVISGGRRDFLWPVPGQYNIKSCFYDKRNHCAIDIAAPKNTVAVASYAGTVLKVVDGGTGYYGDGFGNYVVLQHSYTIPSGVITLYTRYSHLNSASVKEGTTVKAGQEIGKIGTTGNSEGNHLDFQILYGNWKPYQTYSIDPYANQLLELPNNLEITDSWSCGDSYYSLIKELYATPLTYVGQCIAYPSHGTIKVTKDSINVKSLPCSVDTDPTSETIEKAYKNDTYTAIGLYKNTAGNLWYKVEAKKGSIGYIYAGDATFVEQLTDDVKVTDVSAPTELIVGKSFGIKGVIKTAYQTLIRVEAWVEDLNHNYKTGEPEEIKAQSYNLESSGVDKGVVFNDLEEGTYYYYIAATVQTYYASDAKTLATKSLTPTLYISSFNIVKSSTCSHSYTSSVTKAATCGETGVRTYTCSKCGNKYTESIAATGDHNYIGKVTSAASCNITGVRTYTCSGCSNSYEEEIPATGNHNYGGWNVKYDGGCTQSSILEQVCTNCGYAQEQSFDAPGHRFDDEIIPANCVSPEMIRYTCRNCGYSYEKAVSEEYSQWSAEKPSGVNDALIESKTQYRYSDYETKTSYESALNGYDLLSSTWEQSGTGSQDLVKNWPSGYNTGHSLYSQYNKTSISNSETASTKTSVTGEAIVGYLYYHWCRGSYTDGPINRKISKVKTSEFSAFHSFYSTTNPSTLKEDTNEAGCYTYAKSSCCKDSHWYYCVPVYRQNYTNYNKLYSFGKWSDWSAWSDTVYTATSIRKVETQTLYRYTNAQLGDHSWNGGVVTVEPTCIRTGVKTYTCSLCSATKMEEFPSIGHNYYNGYCSRCDAKDPNYQFVTAQVKVGTVTGNPGDTVTVPVSISSNPGFAGFTFVIDYNTSALTLVEITKGDLLNASESGAFTKNISGKTVNWTDSVNITGNGIVLKLTFKITDGAAGGNYAVTLALKNGSSTNFVDENAHAQNITFQNGKIGVHSYTSKVTAATCTAQGYTIYTCSSCGYSYKANYTDALGHSYSYKATKAPTASATGVLTGTCSQCSGTTTVTLPKLTTTDYTYSVTKAATCTAAGTGRYTWKTITYGSFYFDVTISATGVHTWSAWHTDTEPDCIQTGIKTCTCSVCGAIQTETLPSLGHDYQNGYCSRCEAVDPNHQVFEVSQWNIALKDSFEVKFYLNVSQNIASTAKVRMTIGNETATCNISALEKTADGYYLLKAKVSAAQMNDFIVVMLMNGGKVESTNTYTVRQYCDTILADSTHSQYHALVKEMLNYGAMAQVYFDYDIENLANTGITGTAATAVPGSVQELKLTDNISGLDFYGASLVYRDRIAVRYYFTGDITGLIFTANGNIYTPVAKDGMYYVEIADILPQDLEQQITLTVVNTQGGTLSVTYGPMNYIIRMNEKGSAELKALVKALYNYHLAAKTLSA